MPERRLLIDNITFISLPPDKLLLAEQNAKNNRLEGLLIQDIILQEKDGKNQNQRVYPGDILVREVENYKKQFIENKSSFGELDHPDTPIIRLKEVSHIITEVWWNDNLLKGDLNIIDTPNGKIAQSILRAGGRLGVSSRSLGSVEKVRNEENEAYDKVGNDLELICWDLVSNPSVLRASFMLNEGLDKNEEILRCKKVNEIIDLILK